MADNKIIDVAIIGAGPAGMTAAVYAKRAEMDVTIFDAGAPGGKIVTTAEIENYPGAGKTTGPDLALEMLQHVNELGVSITGTNVDKIVIDKDDIKELHTSRGVFYARSVIIATGTLNRKLDVKNYMRYENRGITYCAICDGSLYKNKEVIVVGGGNSAVEESLYLAGIASQVKILIRRDVFRADPSAITQLENTPNIKIYRNTEIKEILGDGKQLTGVVAFNNQTNKEFEIDASGVFVYVGLVPSKIDIEGKSLKVDSTNFNVVDENMETSLPGIFSAGDINSKKIRQIVTAVSDGAIAALSAKNYVNGMKNNAREKK